jgi:tetratricopeptide (TPR) repeat protein
MNKKNLLVGILTLILVYGCDRQAKQMDADAKVCDKALELGKLEMAEEYCQKALGDLDADILPPKLKSERLYKLGNIMRQRAKFSEAADMLRRSLEIEESISAPDSPEVARRLVELAVIAAGQMNWDGGMVMLERALPACDKLTGKDRVAAANVLKHYAKELKQGSRADLALRFEAKSEQLSSSSESE